MPAISMFYGIVIYLYFFDDERHKLPHVHARFQGQDASFSIVDGAVIAGAIPTAKAKLVQAWIEIHREELVAKLEALRAEAKKAQQQLPMPRFKAVQKLVK